MNWICKAESFVGYKQEKWEKTGQRTITAQYTIRNKHAEKASSYVEISLLF